MSKEYADGYRHGWHDALRMVDSDIPKRAFSPEFSVSASARQDFEKPKKRKKRPLSKKQRILNEMTDKKWKTYKKGRGKKTWVDIRSEVSRSQAYKKKVKNL